MFEKVTVSCDHCVAHDVPCLSVFPFQGISYLDAMQELWNRRGWNQQSLDQDFRIECQRWLELLLSLVDVTMPNAPTLLKRFLHRRQGVLGDRTFRTYVTKQVSLYVINRLRG